MSRTHLLATIAAISLTLLCVSVAIAANHTWTGGGLDNAWSTTGNWLGGVAPDGDDNIIFDNNSSAKLVNSNDISGLTGITITIIDSSGDVTIDGFEIGLAGGTPIDLSASNRNLTINCPLTLSADSDLSVNIGRTLTINGTINGAYEYQAIGGGSHYLNATNVFPNLSVDNGTTAYLNHSNSNLLTIGATNGSSVFVNASQPGVVSVGLSIGSLIELNGILPNCQSIGWSDNSTVRWGIDNAVSGDPVNAGFSQNSVLDLNGYYQTFDSYGCSGYTVIDLGSGSVTNWANTCSLMKGTGTITGSLNVTGTLSPTHIDTQGLGFQPGTYLNVELNGPVAGVQYSQVQVSGVIDVSGANLSVALGFNPSVGTEFTIIDNDGADAVSGTFNGLAEGDHFGVFGYTFQISYMGGTGNDVVITVTGAPYCNMPLILLLN